MAEKKNKIVLDACTLIAFLRKEKGHENVITLMNDDTSDVFMHAINLGEVYYDTLRSVSREKANMLFVDIALLPIQIEWNIDKLLLELAGKYKTRFQVSYADAFVLGFTDRENATLATTDHNEFEPVEKNSLIKFFWVR